MNKLFIDTYFENASPLRWEEIADDVIHLEMIPDHERFSPNRQLTHWNFRVHCEAGHVGATVKFLIGRLDNCWNGRRQPALGKERLSVAVSPDGRKWGTVPGVPSADKRFAVGFRVKLTSRCMQVARNVPYTDSDLKRLLGRVKGQPAVRVYRIGATVEGRPLEMVEVGNPRAEDQVLLRARAHPWESGGSWFLEGLVNYLTSGRKRAGKVLDSVCFCLMPMAGKDGVHRGMTRFNVRGIDLNRGWSAATPADPVLAPENVCLQNWLTRRQRQGRLPKLAVCLHNDSGGKLHFSHPRADAEGYLRRMALLESLLKEMTWFTEGSAPRGFLNEGTFGEGVMEMYGVDALIYELNAEWAEGLHRPPLHTDWQRLGADFAGVAWRYFKELG